MSLEHHTPTYSDILSPQGYNHLTREEHIFIQAADKYIGRLIQKEARKKTIDSRKKKGGNKANARLEVVEAGSGPGSVPKTIPEIIRTIDYTGVDYDRAYNNFARAVLAELHIPGRIVETAIEAYQHPTPVDVFFSQGVHHHIQKGLATRECLKNIFTQLRPGGAYILSDEFLAEYSDDTGRLINAVLWYSLVNAAAQQGHHQLLAQEEAKTLLDDLNEGSDPSAIKTQKQIELFIASAPKISALSENDLSDARAAAKVFLDEVARLRNTIRGGDAAMDLSRGDFKICDSVFRQEVEPVGFVVESRKTIGPVDRIGGMAIYVLRKPI